MKKRLAFDDKPDGEVPQVEEVILALAFVTRFARAFRLGVLDHITKMAVLEVIEQAADLDERSR